MLSSSTPYPTTFFVVAPRQKCHHERNNHRDPSGDHHLHGHRYRIANCAYPTLESLSGATAVLQGHGKRSSADAPSRKSTDDRRNRRTAYRHLAGTFGHSSHLASISFRWYRCGLLGRNGHDCRSPSGLRRTISKPRVCRFGGPRPVRRDQLRSRPTKQGCRHDRFGSPGKLTPNDTLRRCLRSILRR